jgi:hypothetical protein
MGEAARKYTAVRRLEWVAGGRLYARSGRNFNPPSSHKSALGPSSYLKRCQVSPISAPLVSN